ncbi:MAG: hypothetical protein AAB320_02880 [Elusimicrobiota bacterium]
MAFISASDLFEKYKAASAASQSLLRLFTEIYQSRRQLLFWAALGTSGPALFYACLLFGLSAAQAAALTAAAGAALAQAEPPEGSAPWLATAASALASVVLLLPCFGLKLTAGAGLLLATASLLCRRPAPAPEPLSRAPVWLIALVLAAVPAWVRCLSLMMGHSLYAAVGALTAACLAFAAAHRLRPLFQEWVAEDLREGLAILAAGAGGFGALAALRFIGLSASGAEHLRIPLQDAADVLFIAVQSCAVFGLAVLPAALAQRPRPRAPWQTAAGAAFGAALGALLLPLLGPLRAVVLAQAALILAGLAAAGPRRIWESPAAKPVVGAALLAAAASAWLAGGLFTDIWLNRLDAAYPGGRFLVLQDDGRQSLGAYRFSSGAKVLLQDGAARYTEGESSRQAHIAMLLHPAPAKVLLLGMRSPSAITAVLQHRVEADVIDAHPGAGAVLAALSKTDGWPPAAGARFLSRDLRAYLKEPGPVYDLVLLEVPAPWGAPEAAFLGTRQTLEHMRLRLSTGGVAVVFLPEPHPASAQARLLFTAAAVFSHTTAFALPGGLLVAGSDAALPAGPQPLKERLLSYAALDVVLQDPGLSDWLDRLPWTDADTLRRAGRLPGPDTDDRAPGAFPLSEILAPATPAPAPI